MLYMDIEYESGVLVVRLDGNLTKKNVYRINNYLTPVIRKHQIKCFIYNMKKVLKIDESGIDALLRTKYAIKNNRGTIYFCEVPERLKKQMKHLRMKEVENERTALKLFQI